MRRIFRFEILQQVIMFWKGGEVEGFEIDS